MANAPIFIVGYPRSGTTLLRYCLNKHSQIFITPETHFFKHVEGYRRILPKPGGRKYAENIVEILFQPKQYKDPSIFDFLPERVQLINEIEHKTGSHRDAFDIIMKTFANKMGKQRRGEKSPPHLFYIPRILEYFPDALIINLTREAKATIGSFIASPNIGKINFIKALAQYCFYQEYMEKFSDSILNISYEELTVNPEPVLRTVCKYIGEDFEQTMLMPGMHSSYYNNPIGEGPVFKKEIGIVANRTEKYLTILNDEEIKKIDVIVNNTPGQTEIELFKTQVFLQFNLIYFRLKLFISCIGLTGLKDRVMNTIINGN